MDLTAEPMNRQNSACGRVSDQMVSILADMSRSASTLLISGDRFLNHGLNKVDMEMECGGAVEACGSRSQIFYRGV